LNGLALCSGFGGIERGLESRIDGFKTVCHVKPFVMLRGKPTQLRTLLRKYKKEPFMRLLSGLTLKPSTAHRGVANWILSQEDSRVSPIQVRGSYLDKKTQETYGRTLKESLAKYHPRYCSWKTFQTSIIQSVPQSLQNINNTIGPSIVADLAEMGYDSAWCVVRASDVGAPHRRARWFIMAYAHGESSNSELSRTHRKVPSKGRRLQTRKDQREAWCKSGCESKNDDANAHNSNESNMRIHESFKGSSKLEKVTHANTNSERSGKSRKIQERPNGQLSGSESEKRGIDLSNADGQRAERLGLKLRPRPLFERYIDAESIESRRFEDWWAVEPPVGRMVDGVAHWVDRLRGCGNGVVPQQAAYAFDILSTALMNQMEGEI